MPMRHPPRLSAPLLVALAALVCGCASTSPLDASAALARADAAIGASSLKTLTYSGAGSGATFGQAHQPGLAWPGLTYSVLTRAIDYDGAAQREEYARSRSEPTGGGATPLMGQGEARVTSFVRGDHAWNAGPNNAAVPAPVAAPARVHDLWTTPHGAIKAAQRNRASAERRSENGIAHTAVTFTEPGRLAATVWIDSAGLVTRVDSTMPHPVAGDTHATTWYSDWRDVGGGVKFPHRMRQTQGSYPVLDIRYTDVKPNVPVSIALPDTVRDFGERVASTQVADGVWYLAGGSHHSVLVEMRDHLVIVEAPLYDGRTAAVFAEAKRLVPGKPIRTVVNSHHHFDHAGGLRAAVAEGATLVTSAQAKPYYERTFANPNRIAPDLMARSGRQPTILGVAGKHVITDGARSVEVHELQGSIHAQGFLVVWLPKERLLIEADAYTPGAPNAAPPPVPNANNVNLVHNVERLGWQVDRILPLHGRVVPMSELLAAIGRR